jgi:hypothetical protein
MVVKRSKLALAFAAITAVGMVIPAFAGDGGVHKASEVALVPVRLAGVGAAMVIGTPIAVTREVPKQFCGMTTTVADKVGGHDFFPSCLLASVVTAPAAVVVGGGKGVITGSKNAVIHGFGEPFAPKSFSLGNLEE